MRFCASKKIRDAFTLAETAVGVGIAALILAGFTVASVALQRSFVAIEDYTKGTNDQMRISDYLALDMRRAYSVTLSGDCNNPPLTVTITIPNFYTLSPSATPTSNNPANVPNSPHVQGITSWPYKKHHHHHHEGIILNQIVNYGNSWNGTTMADPILTVTYVFDNNAYTLTRQVTDSANNVVNQTVATDVKDFCVTVNDSDETANTKITFKPRFRTVSAAELADANSAYNQNSVGGTTYYQTTLMRNTR